MEGSQFGEEHDYAELENLVADIASLVTEMAELGTITDGENNVQYASVERTGKGLNRECPKKPVTVYSYISPAETIYSKVNKP